MNDNRPRGTGARLLDVGTVLKLVEGRQGFTEARTCPSCERHLSPHPTVRQGVKWRCPWCDEETPSEGHSETEM